MSKYKYLIEFYDIYTGIVSYTTIEASCFYFMIKKFKKEHDYNNNYEIKQVTRL